MPIDASIPLSSKVTSSAGVGDVLQMIQQMRAAKAQAAQRKLELEATQREAEATTALREMVSVGPDGQPVIDYTKGLGHLGADKILAVQNAAGQLTKTMQDASVATLTADEKKRTYLGGLGAIVRAAGDDQHTFELALTAAKLTGALPPTDVTQGFAFSRDPAFRKTITDNAIALAGPPKAADVAEIQSVDEQGRPVTMFVPKTAGTSYQTAPKTAGPRALQAKDVLLDGRPALATFDPDSGTYHVGGEDVTARVRPIPPQGPGPEPIVAIIGADGKPVYVTRSQALGQTPTGGAAGTDKLSAAQQEDIATMLTVQDLGKEAAQLGEQIKWRGVGPVAGRTGALGAKYFGTGGEQPERLRNLLGNIQGTIAKLRGGTSFTPSEQTLLDRYTPTITDSPLQIKTKLKSLSDFITTKRENTLRVAAGQYTPREPQGGTPGTTTTTTPSASGLSYQDYLNRKK